MIKNDFETILEVEKQYKNKIENHHGRIMDGFNSQICG